MWLLFKSKSNSNKFCKSMLITFAQEASSPPGTPQPVEPAPSPKVTPSPLESYAVGTEVVCETGGKFVAAIVINQMANGKHTVGLYLQGVVHIMLGFAEGTGAGWKI
jgi:hypothetical protein